MKANYLKLLACAAFTAVLGANLCTAKVNAAAAEQDETYLAKASELDGKLSDLLNDSGYASIYTAPVGADKIDEWKGNWITAENKKQALVCSIDLSDLTAAIDEAAQVSLPEGLSKTGTEQTGLRALSALPSFINGRAGDTKILMTTNILTVSDFSLMPEQSGQAAFVLRDFGDDHPMVYTSFYVDEEGIAVSSASFVMHSETSDSLFSLTEDELPGAVEELIGEELPENVKKYLSDVHLAKY